MNASAAAKRLGISVKALRLYEEHGLIAPGRSAAGWRVYGPDEMKRAADIVALRALGFSLAQIASVLKDDLQDMDAVLAAHQTRLEALVGTLKATARKVADLRQELAQGRAPALGDIIKLLAPSTGLSVAFDLPWPWGSERFELRDIRAINYITGPLGSGKTRLAMRLAEELPDAAFIGLDRDASNWLDALEAEHSRILVIDMVEQGLDKAKQQALIARLRRRGPEAKSLFLMTRSTAILDLDSVGAAETILYCPANHSAPVCVAPYPGAPGYEALASCLAAPEVRARTAGLIELRGAIRSSS